MAIVWTITLLLFLVLAVTAVRVRWTRLSPSTRRAFLVFLLLCTVLPVLNLLTSWETTNESLDAVLLWMRAVLYTTVVVFFTFLRPRSLTIPISTILLLALFSSSALGRLAGLFPPGPVIVHRIGGPYVLETMPWRGAAGDNSGLDVVVAWQPTWLHGLRRSLRGIRLYSSQCQTANLEAAVDTAHHLILVRCPPMIDSDLVSGTETTVPIP